MASGSFGSVQTSPIVQAIGESEAGTTGEIHVHLSRRWIEKDALHRAMTLFHRLGLRQTRQRNAVLIYVNLRRHRFAILGDQGAHQALGQLFWNEMARELRQGLLSTHPERAIATVVRQVGAALRKTFPDDLDS